MEDFEAFAARHVDDLLRMACLIVWNDHDAEDLVQETLFKVARRWPKIAAMKAPLAYTRKVLVNLATDGSVGRSRRRQELQMPAVEMESSVDPFSELHDRAEMLQALGRLSTRSRAVLVLRFYNDLSEARVADFLGCSTGTVKSSTSRGLAQLRQHLDALSSEPRNRS
jgi:RNA polymerase sigma-70 factor (sigma-E family)